AAPNSLKSPNRQVGDCSFLPTSRCRHETLLNPPTGRLGIVHFSLQPTAAMTLFQIPQPAGWGLFIPTYITMPPRNSLKSPNRQVGDCSFQPTTHSRHDSLPNPPTGRLGIVHSYLHHDAAAKLS